MRILELEFKNFNSYGNQLVKLDFRDPKFYLLYGVSGAGKSTIREAIGYNIYGKVIDKTLGSLVNRLNKKDLYTRTLLECNGSLIEIKRGIKPNLFEVIVDGVPQDVAGKSNIQEILERDWIKMPQATYNNLVTISIDKFASFLKMSPQDKKKVLDQIFGFIVFNKVYDKINRMYLDSNIEIKSLSSQIFVLNENKNKIEKSLQDLISTNKDEKNNELESLKIIINSLKTRIDELNKELNDIKEKESVIAGKKSLIDNNRNNVSSQIRVQKEKIRLYDNNQCPTCSTSLTSEFHLTRKSELVNELEEYDKAFNAYTDSLRKIADVVLKLTEKKSKLRESIDKLVTEFHSNAANYNAIKKSLENNSEQEAMSNLLIETESKINDLEKCTLTKNEDSSLYKEICEIFAEDGIKREILKSILPTLNENINDFTKMLHFPYKIVIDDKFNSIITSMGEQIPVSTLSTGEHKKADFAVLVSIIGIMKRNFPGINLLFIDELLSNIDIDGVNELLQITRTIVDNLNMNVFIINHNELSADVFDYKLQIKKDKGFSRLELHSL